MDQAYFVTASYTVSALLLGGLTLWIFISAKNAKAKVTALEATK